MKNVFLIMLLFLTLTVNLSAQKIIKNEVSSFTKVRNIATNAVYSGADKWVATGFVQFESFNDMPRMLFSYYTEKKYRLPQNTKLELLDDKGEILRFNCIDGGYSNVFIFFGNYEQLIGRNIVKYKLGDLIEGDIHKKKQAIFGNLYQCLKDEMLKYYSEVTIQPSTLEGMKKFTQDKLNEIMNEKSSGALNKDTTIRQ